ncbi:flagellar hook-associated protein FlgK [Chitinimonas lacunae]|uniref:Flagellar hook-associated protein 1 n=1 Tax=Chitinimonas lacunae TaxID=1963018 RepID=A0ABV8MI45_9NEIS
MGNSIFGIAISGLRAAQIGLATTSHNIANASTPGYNRQTMSQSATTPLPSGGGFIGRGVEIDSISRVYNDFVTRQVQSAQAQDGYLSNLLNHLSDLDNMLADPSAGFSPSLQDFFGGIQTVANNPASVPARQSLLGLTEAMVTKLQTVNNRMNQLREDVNGEIKSTVTSINSVTSQIAKLNDQIVLNRGLGNGQAPNDLLDQRDQLVKELNKFVKSTVVTQSDGSYNVFVGNGQNLVVGNQAFTLAAVASKIDPHRLEVAYQQYGVTALIPSKMLTGGSLGGVLEFREQGLDLAQNSLGRVAAAMSLAINQQHRQGQDLNGQIGGNFFRMPMATQTFAEGSNTAVPAESIKFTAELQPSVNFVESDYSLEYDGTNYMVTRLTDGRRELLSVVDGSASAFGFYIKLDETNLTPNTPFNPISFSFLPKARAIPNGNNDISSSQLLSVGIKDASKLTTSDYEFSYEGDSLWTIQRLSDGAKFLVDTGDLDGRPYELDGLQFPLVSSVAGLFQPGDKFLIQPTREFSNNLSVAITDTSKIAAAVPIRTSSDVLNIQAVSSDPAATTISVLSPLIKSEGGATVNPIRIEFDATSYKLVDTVSGKTLKENQPYTGTDDVIELNGWRIQVNGVTAGETIVVTPRKNTGSGTISAGKMSGAPLTLDHPVLTDALGNASPIKHRLAFQFTSATQFDIVDLDAPAPGLVQSGVSFTAGKPILVNGMEFAITGTPAQGDAFLVEPNKGGVADNRNMLAMGKLQTTNLLDGGTTNFQGAYSKTVADVGVKTNQAKINQQAQASLLKQAETKLQDLSGVNLDEEAAGLLSFQQAYMAASRTIQIAQRAFDEVLNIGR